MFAGNFRELILRHHDEVSLATLSPSEREDLLAYFDPEKKFRFATGISMRLTSLLRDESMEVGRVLSDRHLMLTRKKRPRLAAKRAGVVGKRDIRGHTSNACERL